MSLKALAYAVPLSLLSGYGMGHAFYYLWDHVIPRLTALL